jgi:hypothetical protein
VRLCTVAALVPLAKGSSSANTAAALPKGIRAASLAVKKRELRGDGVFVGEDRRETLAGGTLAGAAFQTAHPHGHVAEQRMESHRVGAAAPERPAALRAGEAELAVALDLGGHELGLKGGQQSLGFLQAQAQTRQGKLVRSLQGEQVVFSNRPGSGFGDEFDSPLHDHEPRPGPTDDNALDVLVAERMNVKSLAEKGVLSDLTAKGVVHTP